MKEMTSALIVKNGRLLLVSNIKHGDLRIEAPGGKLEVGESLEECVVRELEEELGVVIKPRRLLGNYVTNSPEGDFNVSMYISDIISGVPVLLEPEKMSGYGWYSCEEIEKIDKFLVPNLREALKDFEF